MLHVKSPDEVNAILLENFGQLRAEWEKVHILASLERTLACDIIAEEFVPGFDRSTVDGYAVRAADTFGALEAIPAMLSYQGEVLMGETAADLEKGCCLYVPTGGEIPKGADAMVMIEDTEDYGDNMRYILRPTAPGRHVSFRGDDCSPGRCVLPEGKRMRPQDVGTLAALGIQEVFVSKKPRVGIISTGDELVDIGSPLRGARIRDVNTYVLSSGVAAAGGEAVSFGIVNDDYELLKATVAQALGSCDIVLISGGSSVGTRDHVKTVLEELAQEEEGGKLLLHGIAMKPGKPTLISRIQDKPVFGLPGHPVAAFFIFHIFAAPLLHRMLGGTMEMDSRKAILTTNIPSNHGREECVAVTLVKRDGYWQATPIPGKSGLISILSKADGYVRVPRDKEGFGTKTEVTVYLF